MAEQPFERPIVCLSCTTQGVLVAMTDGSCPRCGYTERPRIQRSKWRHWLISVLGGK